MSERKSWDVQPKRRPAQPAAASEPAPRTPARPSAAPSRAPRGMNDMRVPVRKAPSAPATRPAPSRAPAQAAPDEQPMVVRSPRKVAQRPTGELKKRRKRQRTVMRYVLLALFIALLGGLLYAAWLPTFRVQSVEAHGPGGQAIQQITQMKLHGTYFYILPRNSVFLLPQKSIRSAILDAVPEASAVSISRTSFSSLEVNTTQRAEAFAWCGTSIDTPLPGGQCFAADQEGFIFKQEPSDGAATTTASSTLAVQADSHGQIRVFSALDRDVSNGALPIRAHILSSAQLPNALRFVDAVRELGAPVSALAIRGDEADLWVSGSTRITYLLGHEHDAAMLAASALPNLHLTDGSIQYVDLRFAGKAYIKRYGE